ncbi:MAG: hypothetical protein R2728_09710 [Chitinophagales bacterium]
MNHQIKIFNSISKVEPDQWALVHDQLPTSMNYQYITLLEEEHKDEIDFYYALVIKNNLTVGIICFQLINFKGAYVKNFFRQEVDRNWWKDLFFKLFYRVLDFINWKLLTTGNIYFTGDKGIYLDSSIQLEEGVKIIKDCFQEVHQFCNKKVTAYMVNNIYDAKDQMIHQYINQERYAKYPVDPDMFMTIKPSWNNFEDYTKDLSSKYRVRLRKVYKDSSVFETKKLTRSQIISLDSELYQLYLNTAEKVDLNLGNLCQKYFTKMAELWGDDFFVMGYFLENRLVGFISILKDGTALDANYMGIDYDVNGEFKLYNRMLLDLVEVSIQLKVAILHLGRTATEMKSTIGATSKQMHIYLRGTNRLVNKGMLLFEPYFEAHNIHCVILSKLTTNNYDLKTN